jgi:hypothetical protein
MEWLIGVAVLVLVVLVVKACLSLRCQRCLTMFALGHTVVDENFAEKDGEVYRYTVHERTCAACRYTEFAVVTDMPGVDGSWKPKPADC